MVLEGGADIAPVTQAVSVNCRLTLSVEGLHVVVREKRGGAGEVFDRKESPDFRRIVLAAQKSAIGANDQLIQSRNPGDSARVGAEDLLVHVGTRRGVVAR